MFTNVMHFSMFKTNILQKLDAILLPAKQKKKTV